MDPLIVSYTAIITMAVLPIVIGSYRSIPSSKKKKETEIMSSRDAWLAPLVGSAVLVLLYVLVKYVSKEMINIFITGYVTFFGSVCIVQLITPELRSLIQRLLNIKPEEPADSPQEPISSNFSTAESASNAENSRAASSEDQSKATPPASSPHCDTISVLCPISLKLKIRKKVFFSLSFDILDILSVILVSAFAAYYVIYKNWIASNVYGEAICFGAISLIHLDSFITGSVLLSGLFLYDIFWVFGTDVMVTVAQSFDAPLLLRFPRNIFASSSQWTMLGLGDIVVPGTI